MVTIRCCIFPSLNSRFSANRLYQLRPADRPRFRYYCSTYFYVSCLLNFPHLFYSLPSRYWIQPRHNPVKGKLPMLPIPQPVFGNPASVAPKVRKRRQGQEMDGSLRARYPKDFDNRRRMTISNKQVAFFLQKTGNRGLSRLLRIRLPHQIPPFSTYKLNFGRPAYAVVLRRIGQYDGLSGANWQPARHPPKRPAAILAVFSPINPETDRLDKSRAWHCCSIPIPRTNSKQRYARGLIRSWHTSTGHAMSFPATRRLKTWFEVSK